MEALILFIMVISLLLLGVPIAIALGLSSILFLLTYSDSSLASIAQTLFSAFEGHYTLLAIPFFILARMGLGLGLGFRASHIFTSLPTFPVLVLSSNIFFLL